MATRADVYKALQAAADKLTGPMKAAVLKAIEAIRRGVSMAEVAKILEGRQPAAAGAVVVPAGTVTVDIATATSVLGRVFTKAGADAAKAWRLASGFDLKAPHIESLMAQRASQLVLGLTLEADATLRAVLVQAVKEGWSWTTTAKMVRPLIGLNERQAQSVMNYRAEMAKAGLTQQRIEFLAAKRTAALVTERAETIARTELQGAANAAQQSLWKAAEAEGLVEGTRRRWITTPDDRRCPRCAAMHGQTVGLDEQFVQPQTGRQVLHPPLHPRCRCAMVRVVRAGRKAAGGAQAA